MSDAILHTYAGRDGATYYWSDGSITGLSASLHADLVEAVAIAQQLLAERDQARTEIRKLIVANRSLREALGGDW